MRPKRLFSKTTISTFRTAAFHEGLDVDVLIGSDTHQHVKEGFRVVDFEPKRGQIDQGRLIRNLTAQSRLSLSPSLLVLPRQLNHLKLMLTPSICSARFRAMPLPLCHAIPLCPRHTENALLRICKKLKAMQPSYSKGAKASKSSHEICPVPSASMASQRR